MTEDNVTIRGVLIDPRNRQIKEIRIRSTDVLKDIQRHISYQPMNSFRIAEFDESHDYGWVYDMGISNGKPIHAFKLSGRSNPIAGNCVIIGADLRGETMEAKIPLDFLIENVQWLGVITPKLVWEKTSDGIRGVVTYESENKYGNNF